MFFNNIVAAAVANRSHKLEESHLTVKLVKKEKPRPTRAIECHEEEGELPSATIEVSNINPKTSEDTLEMYFESKRFGGGPIVSKTLQDGAATITFEDPIGNYRHHIIVFNDYCYIVISIPVYSFTIMYVHYFCQKLHLFKESIL